MSETFPLVPIDESSVPKSIEQWVIEFRTVFGTANKGLHWWGYERRMNRAALAMTCPKYHVLRRLTDYDRFAGKFFAWLCGLIKTLDISDVSRAVLLEYPDACPRCFRSQCDGFCSQSRDRRKACKLGVDLIAANGTRYFSLQELASYALRIYPGNADMDLATISGRFADEVRELSKGLDDWRGRGGRKNPRGLAKVYEELPDVLMWFASAWHVAQLEKSLTMPIPRSLDEVLWEVYKVGCPDCSPRTGVRQCCCGEGQRDAQLYLEDVVEGAVVTA